MKILIRLTRKLPQIAGSLAFLITILSSPVVLRAAAIAATSPTDLIATVPNCRQVELSWTASTDEAGGSGLYGYIIQRWEGGNLWNEVTIGAAHTTFSDTYRVRP